MKKLLIPLLLIFSINPASGTEQQQFSDQQKTEKTTGSFIKLLDNLVAKNVITASHLQRLHESTELMNPMTAEDRAISSTNLVYAKGLDSFIAQGKQFIDLARVKEWLIAKIAELEKTETTRKEVHEDTRELHRPMRFVPIPAGKYVDQITHEEFEILPGIEIQETPVTQWQWVQIMGPNPSNSVDGLDSEEVVVNGHKVKMRPDASVENVSWSDVRYFFIEILNEQSKEYVYALPSVGEYQVISAFKQHGSFVEYQGKRVWDIVGKIWQFTRNTVEVKDKQAHLVFGGEREIKGAKDAVRPVVYDQSKSQAVGFRLMRYKKQSLCDQKVTNYSSKQLAWNNADVLSAWRWDAPTHALLFKDDSLRWMFDHNNEYAEETQHTLDVLLQQVPTYSDPVEYLTNLTELHLVNYQLKDVSPLAHLSNLTDLVLDKNQLKDVSSLAGLTKLNVLSLSNNQLQDISSLPQLADFAQLWLSNNEICDVSPLLHQRNLAALDLSDNQIQDASLLAQLTNLALLRLSHNQITDASSLAHLSHLYELDLSHNQIQDASSLAHLTALTIIDLSHNQIQDASLLTHLTNLIWLSLADNQIQDVSSLAHLTKLFRLDISGNPISIISNSDNPVIQKEEEPYRCSHQNLRNCYYQYIAPFFQRLSYGQTAT